MSPCHKEGETEAQGMPGRECLAVPHSQVPLHPWQGEQLHPAPRGLRSTQTQALAPLLLCLKTLTTKVEFIGLTVLSSLARVGETSRAVIAVPWLIPSGVRVSVRLALPRMRLCAQPPRGRE